MFIADGGFEDTIVARATAAGPAARAIIRISGPSAFRLAAMFFDGPLDRSRPRVRVAGRIALEDVRLAGAAIGWAAPRSFTGEDLVELHLPSAPPLVERLLEALARAGARAARPGEFTRRAFLASRIDLAAAESVLALAEASTEAEARAAARELRGGLGCEVERLRRTLLDALAELEAALDFASEDIEAELLSRAGFIAALADARDALARILAREKGRGAGDRPPVAVLFGPPNAGKSSLLNALAGTDHALVSPLPGTTRDPVAVRIRAGDVEVELVDAAGVTPARGDGGAAPEGLAGDSAVDADAEARAVAHAASADIAIVVIDGSVPLDRAGRAALEKTRPRARLLVLQKSDLPRAALTRESAVAVSAWTGAGLEDLRRAIATRLAAMAPAEGAGVGANARHRACLERARAHVDAALGALAAGAPHEVVAIDLRVALDALGEVTGASCPEDVLDRIFARFCLGK